MQDHHRKVLTALSDVYDESEDWCYQSFAGIVNRTGMDRKEVRRICRHLARKGWAEYGKGLWSEDGDPVGSGYRITEAGVAALEKLK